MITPREICQKCLQQARALRVLNMFITETPELAVQQANLSSERLKGGTGKFLQSNFLIFIALK
jgi:hypothetical protein